MSILSRQDKNERRIFGDEYMTDGFAFEEETETQGAAQEETASTVSFADFFKTFPSTKEAEQAQEVANETQVPQYDESDLLPTSTTMDCYQKEDESSSEAFFAERVGAKTSASVFFRSKAVIAAYAIVILTLITLVAVNAAALLRERTNVRELQSEIAMLEETDAELVNELGILTDETNILENGFAMGMNEASAPARIELLSTTESEAMTLEGNWFNDFCDFLSGVFS